jgi:hypothetical protein
MDSVNKVKNFVSNSGSKFSGDGMDKTNFAIESHTRNDLEKSGRMGYLDKVMQWQIFSEEINDTKSLKDEFL